MTPADSGSVEALVGPDGVLKSADDRVIELQRDAGGERDGQLGDPQLAALARLARRQERAISRPIVAASPRSDISMWVRARPEGQDVRLTIVDWQERPANPPLQAASHARQPWRWRIDARLRIVMFDGPEALRQAAPPIGKPFTAWIQLLETASGETPMLEALAGHVPFADQPAVLRDGSERRLRLAGQPLFDDHLQLSGFQGVAEPEEEDWEEPAPEGAEISPPAGSSGEEPGAPPLVDLATTGLFGRRLDGALRAPLGRIIANADSIKEQVLGPVRDDYATYAADIAEAGRHLLALVDDLADLRAIERPGFSVACEKVDLADLARRAAGLLTVKAADKGIRMDAPGTDEQLVAAGEFRRILQILVNLIGNAVRYSPEGSSIWIRVEEEDGKARLTVADQGPGIPKEAQERIFDKFERLGRGDAGGSGLGLYISRRLARAMRGDIGIDSAPGQGARFLLTLPLWTD